MRPFIALQLIILSTLIGLGQSDKINSLKKTLVAAQDTQRATILNELSSQYYSSAGSFALQKDSMLHIAQSYAEEAKSLSAKINFNKGLGESLLNLGNIIMNSSDRNYHKALVIYQVAFPLLRQAGKEQSASRCLSNMADCYHLIGELNTAILYFDSTKVLSLKLKDTISAINSLSMKGHCYFDIGNYKEAYKVGMDAWKLAEKIKDTISIITTLSHLSNLFLGVGLPEITIDNMHRIMMLYPSALHQNTALPRGVYMGLINGGEAFLKLDQVDSAFKIAQTILLDTTSAESELFYGHLFSALHLYPKALTCFTKGFQLQKESGLEIGVAKFANELGQVYLKLKNYTSAIYYANTALATALKIPALLESRNAVGSLTDIYSQTKNYEQVFHYSQWYKSLSDSLSSEEYRRKLSFVQIQNELDKQKQQALLLSKENEIKEQRLSKEELIKKIFIGSIIALLLVVGIVFRGYKQKQKTNTLLRQQKEKVESTLQDLKSTQTQLIQSEKMASLGELTAGIAHEIQNPLNFVNNFSEVNNELIKEFQEAASIKQRDASNEAEIIANIKENSEKINHHGKRAESIVKGMLQHSRKSTGTKEPTNINALADEYMRLSYHGLRAKDKSFNAEFKINLDPTLPLMNVIPQDIGRVLLNLFNNAFWAVNEKSKNLAGLSENTNIDQRGLSDGHTTNFAGFIDTKANPNLQGYKPLVTLATKNLTDHIEIRIHDNGFGIPPNIIDKIFQPFFTTKPTGQGTGLGLSLAYDIIKAHLGSLSVTSNYREPGDIKVESIEARLAAPARSGSGALAASDGDDPRLNDSVGQAVGRGSYTIFTIVLPM